jgi:hypothetical protein
MTRYYPSVLLFILTKLVEIRAIDKYNYVVPHNLAPKRRKTTTLTPTILLLLLSFTPPLELNSRGSICMVNQSHSQFPATHTKSMTQLPINLRHSCSSLLRQDTVHAKAACPGSEDQGSPFAPFGVAASLSRFQITFSLCLVDVFVSC